MKFQPYSLHHAPASLPIWQRIVEDLGNPHPRHLARVLGLGLRTIYRYNRDAQAPRHVCLALFWLTRWGRSEIHCQAVNDCTLAVSYANALETELRQARTQLAHVLAISDTGAANGPLTSERHHAKG
jgi:predicted DNA-binding transcriptional regulator AlpA